MPPKRKARPEKRQKREHPHVENWYSLSALSKEIGNCVKQQQQYIALLMQVSELTQHDASVPDNPWTGEQINFQDVRGYVLSWMDDFNDNVKNAVNIRDGALQSLKNADTNNDDDLKSAAAMLTEAEINLKRFDTFLNRWGRIVRYKNKKITLREHTDTWLTRWLRQWENTNATKSNFVAQFQETLTSISRDTNSPTLRTN